MSGIHGVGTLTSIGLPARLDNQPRQVGPLLVDDRQRVVPPQIRAWSPGEPEHIRHGASAEPVSSDGRRCSPAGSRQSAVSGRSDRTDRNMGPVVLASGDTDCLRGPSALPSVRRLTLVRRHRLPRSRTLSHGRARGGVTVDDVAAATEHGSMCHRQPPKMAVGARVYQALSIRMRRMTHRSPSRTRSTSYNRLGPSLAANVFLAQLKVISHCDGTTAPHVTGPPGCFGVLANSPRPGRPVEGRDIPFTHLRR
jgi:hypothetical protein